MLRPTGSKSPKRVSLVMAVLIAMCFTVSTTAWGAIIEFRYSLGSGQTGTVTEVAGPPVSYLGTDILIDQVVLTDVPAFGPGIFTFGVTDGAGAGTGGFGLLNFNTDPGSNFLTVSGAIPTLGGGVPFTSTLLTGSFDSFTFENPGGGPNFSFTGFGPDTKDATLLSETGLTGATFQFATIDLGGNWNGTSGNPTTNAGVVNSVPVPTSMLLFATGLIGFVSIARRKEILKRLM